MRMSHITKILLPMLLFISNVGEAADLGLGVYKIFAARCFQCHGNPDIKPGGGMDYILDFTKLRSSRNLELTAPEKSVLYNYVQTGYMPMGEPPLNPNEVELILEWIRAGAPAPVTQPTFEDFVSPQVEAQFVIDDLLGMPAAQRRSLPLSFTNASTARSFAPTRIPETHPGTSETDQ